MKKDETAASILWKSIRGLFFLPFWHAQKLRRRDMNVWLFGSWFGQKYSDNSRAMYEYLLANEPDITPMWITRNPKVYDRLKSMGRPVQMADSAEGISWCRKAGVVFVTTTPDEMNSRYLNGARFVWLWHGMPLKQIMADEAKFLKGKQSLFKRFKVRLNHFLFPYDNCVPHDWVMNSADFFCPFFASAFEVPESQVWTDGYPRNDALFEEGHEDIIRRYREKYPTAKFIIYMPTHRVNALKGTPFNGFEGFGFDADRFNRVLEEQDYVFFNKGHFFDSGAGVKVSGERFVNVTDDDYDNLYSFVKDMDLLITDFSSIYFDYIMLGKPIVTAPFDYDDYLKNERPLYFDYSRWGAARANNWDELFAILENRSYREPDRSEMELFHNNLDGNSCKRITEHLRSELCLKKR